MDTETEVPFHIPTVCGSSYFSSIDTLSHNLGTDNVQECLHNVDLTVYVMMQIADNYLSVAEDRQSHLIILHSY
jgi:hypothetical protein